MLVLEFLRSLVICVVAMAVSSHPYPSPNESSTHMTVQVLAKSLAKHGIDTTIISDSAVFAMMARVNKVN